MKRLLHLILLLFVCINIYSIDDIIITKDNKQIQCKIKRVTDDNVIYIKTDTYNNTENYIAVSDIKLIQYSDGSKKTFTAPEPQKAETIYVVPEPQQPETIYIAPEPQKAETIYIASEAQQPIVVKPESTQQSVVDPTSIQYSNKRLAIVDSYAGVYVFNDNTPVSEYEIIGEVGWGNRGFVSSNVAVNPLTGDIATYTTISSSAQYTNIRNNLVTNAVLANRDVEGIIIKTPREGEGSALMIKFKNKDANNALARVNVHRGLLVFSDCKPFSEYDGVKKVKANAVLSDSGYNHIRDNILKKAAKKKGINGIIIYLVDGGRDYAETIYIQ